MAEANKHEKVKYVLELTPREAYVLNCIMGSNIIGCDNPIRQATGAIFTALSDAGVQCDYIVKGLLDTRTPTKKGMEFFNLTTTGETK